MIKKILIVALVLFAAYSAFVQFIAPAGWHASQHQWQDNVIKAEKFIYNDVDSIDNIIVGSSLSCRLAADSLPNTYNLSFAGQSIYDGLSILKHKAKVPQTIFIEMNVALKKESEDFTSVLNSPVLYYPKMVFVSLRNDRQPLGVLGAELNDHFIRKNIVKAKSVLHLGAQNDAKQKEDQELLFKKLLQLKLESYSETPSAAAMDECFGILKKDVAELESKGATIVFFEMPVNYQLLNLSRATAIRQGFYTAFPQSRYEYIPLPDTARYITTDGVHLSGPEALEYTSYLRIKIRKHLRK